MCGITGFVAGPQRSAADRAHLATQMAHRIRHRGPDDKGCWADPDTGVTLAHLRLAVVDLTPAGHQPMTSTCGRYVIVFNGEIYNHLELRELVPPQSWRGHSDTESLLACLTALGLQKTLPMLVGMYAFAVWDRERRVMTLVRDRLGEKPLYHGRLPDGTYVFASELSALQAHPAWKGDIDRDAVTALMRTGCIGAPHSIFKGISKLPPGHWADIDANGQIVGEGPYWDLTRIAVQRQREGLDWNDAQALERLHAVLDRAIGQQMVADVPVGAFLSGGIDSSLVVALMRHHSRQKIRTFSIGFSEAGYNEAVHARAVAEHLGTIHTEHYVTAADALEVVPRLATLYDEPFADSSQIPTHLVARLARQQVTVALSGDAGDEVFGGYNRYLATSSLWPRVSRWPLPLRRIARRLLLGVRPQTLNAVGLLASRWRGRPPRLLGDQVHKFADTMLSAADARELYRLFTSQYRQPASLVLGGREPHSPLERIAENADWVDPATWMMLADQLTYLPDDILAKVDRAAMAVALETRVPMLDHRVVELGWQLPVRMKIRDGQGKWLLRQLLYRHVPRALIERPKQGFAVPIDAWLRGPLRDWAEALLAPERLHREGFLDVSCVRQTWKEHLTGAQNRQHQLWNILMFQSWLQQQGQKA